MFWLENQDDVYITSLHVFLNFQFQQISVIMRKIH